MNISRVVTGITLSFLTFHTACTAGAASLWLVQHRCNAINLNVIPLLSGRQGQAIHHVALYLAIGPARLGTARARARHGPEDVGPARHAVPPVPCRCGPRAWPAAQNTACGPKSVPCRPARHGQIIRSCQPEARRVQNISKKFISTRSIQI